MLSTTRHHTDFGSSIQVTARVSGGCHNTSRRVKKAPCEQPGYIHEWGSSPTFASARICTFQTYNSLSHTEESCSAYDTMPHNPQLLTPTPIPHPHTLRCEEHNPFQPLSHSKKSSKQASKQAAAPAVPSSVVVLFLKQSTFMQQ